MSEIKNVLSDNNKTAHYVKVWNA